MGKQFSFGAMANSFAGNDDPFFDLGRSLFGQEQANFPQGTRTVGFGGGPNPDGSMSLSGEPQEVDANGIPITRGNDITVMGGMPQSSPSPEPDFDEMPRSLRNVEEVMEMREQLKQGEDAAQFKGMFGTKGTLRDILGVLGDAFLMQGGANPMYAPQRQRERAAAAMAGYADDPRGAAGRMVGVDPDLAMKIGQQADLADYRKQQEGRLIQQAQNTRANQRATQARFVRQQIANLFKSPAAQANPQEALRYAMSAAANAGFSLEELGISSDMTADQMGMYSSFNFPVGQQVRAEQGDERLEISRNRPGPRPRAETDSEKYIRIGNTPKEERSAGEQDWYEKKSNRTRREPRQPSQSGANPRFRPAGGNQ